MKQVCLICERTSLDKNLYCQEIYCPAEMSPNIMGYGEWLGDIEIIKAVMVLRSAVLYEVRHQKKKLLLKIAHPGTENTNRLKREAEFLKELRIKRQQNLYLPSWLPPYANMAIDARSDAYGKAMLGGHLLYFYLFEHFPGEPLRDVLTKNPQLWINHVGWIMTNMSSAVAFLQSKGMFHYGLSPDCLLVHFDQASNVPQVMLFDLGIISSRENLAQNWYSSYLLPAYMAPELINVHMPQPNYATDVYGLGLTLYELLVGEPCFPFKLRSDDEVTRSVWQNHRVKMNRTEDVKMVADIALQAVNKDIPARYPSAAVMAEELLKHFNKVPPAKKSRMPSLNTSLLIVVTLLTIAFLITFAVTITQFDVL